MRRWSVFGPWLLLVAVIVGVLHGGLLPGRAFVPLTPDDFPAWAAGRHPDDLRPHPHPNYTMSDTPHLLIPGLQVTRAALERGEFPSWDSSQALGLPHLAQIHYGVLYPPAWLAVWLGVRGLGLMAVLHLAAATLGMLLYLRSLHRSALAAMVGAISFGFSAWVVARLHSFPLVGAAVWTPWIVWGLERAAQGGGRRYRVAAAAGVALSFLAGHPQTSAWVLAMVAFVELWRLLRHATRREPVFEPGIKAAGTVLLGLAMAAPQLWPTVDYMRSESLRHETQVEAVVAERLEPELLWHLILPELYADASLDWPVHPLAARDLEQGRRPFGVNRAETSMSIGVLGLVLALTAMLRARGWRARAYTVVALGVFVVLLSETLLRALFPWMPLLAYGSPKRLLMIATFALSVLAAGGADLVRGERLSVAVVAWIGAVGLTVAAVAQRLSLPRIDTGDALEAEALEENQRAFGELADEILAASGAASSRAEVLTQVPPHVMTQAVDAAATSALIAIAMGIVAVIVVRPRRHHSERGWMTLAQRGPALLALFMLVELLLQGIPLVRSAPAMSEQSFAEGSRLFRAPALATLAAATEPDASQPVRLARFGNDPPYLRPNFPSLFGLDDLQCYAPMPARRSAELLSLIEDGVVLSSSALGGFLERESLESPWLDALGVRAMLLHEPEWTPAGYSEEGRVGHVRVLRNDEALPRAYVLAEVEVIAEDAARRARLGEPGFDPRRTAVVDRDWQDLPELPPRPEGLPEAVPSPPWSWLGVWLSDDGNAEDEADPGDEAGDGADGSVDDAQLDEDDAGDDAGDDAQVGEDGAGEDDDVANAGEDDAIDEPATPVELPRAAMLIEHRPGRLLVEVASEGPAGVLVVSESWSHGWRARVNGADWPVLCAQHALIGVPLPAEGPAVVELVYEPPRAAHAARAGGVAWLLALVLLLWPRRETSA